MDSSGEPSDGGFAQDLSPDMYLDATEDKAKRQKQIDEAKREQELLDSLPTGMAAALEIFTLRTNRHADSIVGKLREEHSPRIARLEQKMKNLEDKEPSPTHGAGRASGFEGSPTTASGASSTASGKWVATHLDVKLCEFKRKAQEGCSLMEAKAWLVGRSRVDPRPRGVQGRPSTRGQGQR